MRTLLGQYYLDFFWLKFAEAREKLLLALELAQRMQDHQTEAMCHFYAAVAALIAGNTAALKRSATSCLETAQKVRDKRRHSIGYRVAAVVYTTEGGWLDARESSLRGLELSPYDPVALVGESTRSIALASLMKAGGTWIGCWRLGQSLGRTRY